MSEAILQQTLVAMLKQLYPDFIISLSLSGISLNGTAKDNAQTMQAMVKQGFQRGLPDLLIYLPHGQVLNLELKTDKGKQSPDQLAMQANLIKLGHNYFVIRTVYEAFAAIADFTDLADRQHQFSKLAIPHNDLFITEPFMHFAKGTNYELVKDFIKQLYHI